MKSKKGLSEVIVTILFVLIGIAAVIIVWQVIKAQTQGTANQITTQTNNLNNQLNADLAQGEEQAQCAALSLEILKFAYFNDTVAGSYPQNTTFVRIRRSAETTSVNLASIKVYFGNDETKSFSSDPANAIPSPGSNMSYTRDEHLSSVTYTVTVKPILAGGKECPVIIKQRQLSEMITAVNTE